MKLSAIEYSSSRQIENIQYRKLKPHTKYDTAFQGEESLFSIKHDVM
jgi:hypothetical protein